MNSNPSAILASKHKDCCAVQSSTGSNKLGSAPRDQHVFKSRTRVSRQTREQAKLQTPTKEEMRNINAAKKHLNLCFVWLSFICVVLEEMELEVLSSIKSDTNCGDAHKNEYMEDRSSSWGL